MKINSPSLEPYKETSTVSPAVSPTIARLCLSETAMPIYAYKCAECGHPMEAIQKVSDARLTECPSCGKPALVKQLTAAGFHLKGGGWYVTDFRDSGSGKKKDSGKPDKQDEATKSDQASDSKTEAKSDSKADTAADSKGAAKTEAKTESKSESKSDSGSKPAPAPASPPKTGTPSDTG